jgi:hypothetical protein
MQTNGPFIIFSCNRNKQVQGIVDEVLSEIDLAPLRHALVGSPGGLGE